MNTEDIKNQIATLKQHLDEVQVWAQSTLDLIYKLEESILDHEEKSLEPEFIRMINKRLPTVSLI
jgi:hypothetical protein